MHFIELGPLNIFTPLGIRLWDAVMNRQVRSGMTVTARSANRNSKTVMAYRTASDIYAFRGLPGLRGVEFADPRDVSTSSPSSTHPFVIEVHDPLNRYLSIAFTVSLPLPYRGLFLVGDTTGSPSTPPPGLFLFSDPRRRIDSRVYAQVRGELVDVSTRRAAAHAMVRLTSSDGRIWFGPADAEGRFVVLLPWPPPAQGFGGSPQNPNRKSVFDQVWDVTVEVRYQRALPIAGSSLPDYSTILNQAAGSIWRVAPENGGAEQSQLASELNYGETTVLKTGGLSHLLVSPTVSSP